MISKSPPDDLDIARLTEAQLDEIALDFINVVFEKLRDDSNPVTEDVSRELLENYLRWFTDEPEFIAELRALAEDTREGVRERAMSVLLKVKERLLV